MFREGTIRSAGAPQNDAWFCHGRGNNCRIARFFCEAFAEHVGPRAPGFRSGFHRWCRDSEIEEPRGGLIGLKPSRHSLVSLHDARRTRHNLISADIYSPDVLSSRAAWGPYLSSHSWALEQGSTSKAKGRCSVIVWSRLARRG